MSLLTSEKVLEYQKEVRELYKDRMNETPKGEVLITLPSFHTFNEALSNFHLLSSDEDKETIDWCIRHAVLDATENFILTLLIEDGYYKGNLDNEYPESTSDSSIIHDENGNYISIFIRTTVEISNGFSTTEFNDLMNLKEILKQCIKSSYGSKGLCHSSII
jgi:hypothetical protein